MATSTATRGRASGNGAVEDRTGQLLEIACRLFATHGYGVFQPQFRGSSGFGLRH